MPIRFVLKIYLLAMVFCCLATERVDVIADFDLSDIPTNWKLVTSCDFDLGLLSFENLGRYVAHSFDSEVKRVILMNPYVASEQELGLLPREKLVLFAWEPMPVDPAFYNKVGRVYTYNDSLVDGKHYFKLFYPFRRNMLSDCPKFEDKKLCTLVSRHWTTERMRIVQFFGKYGSHEFEFYGSDPGPFGNHKSYRGAIAGYHSGEKKIAVLKNYKFCICFENSYHLPGYITEKIFSCFAAGCIPIYYGAPNIDRYIPKNCFIDYREFPNMSVLYQFMKNMPEKTYQQYISNIRAYLASDQSYQFSPEHFQEIVLNAILQN